MRCHFLWNAHHRLSSEPHKPLGANFKLHAHTSTGLMRVLAVVLGWLISRAAKQTAWWEWKVGLKWQNSICLVAARAQQSQRLCVWSEILCNITAQANTVRAQTSRESTSWQVSVGKVQWRIRHWDKVVCRQQRNGSRDHHVRWAKGERGDSKEGVQAQNLEGLPGSLS